LRRENDEPCQRQLAPALQRFNDVHHSTVLRQSEHCQQTKRAHAGCQHRIVGLRAQAADTLVRIARQNSEQSQLRRRVGGQRNHAIRRQHRAAAVAIKAVAPWCF